MRRLINAYAGWIDDKVVNGDAFDALLGFTVGSITIVVILGALFTALIAIAVALAGPEPQHGSCKVGHYQWSPATKTQQLVCDEWYPLPQVNGQ